MVDGGPHRGHVSVEERPSSPSPGVPLATSVDEAVTAFATAVRREVRRAVLGVVFGLVGIVLLLVVALGFAVTGIMRLGDALARLGGRWLGDPALGDLAVGVVLLTVPLIGVLALRWRVKR